MFISHKYKFVFIKTRKTAGSSIEHFLLSIHQGNEFAFGGMPPENLKPVNIATKKDVEHAGWSWIMKKFPVEWRTYYKFSVERNSWDKVVSTYYWQKKYGPWRIKNFDDYIKTQGKLFNRGCWGLYTKQNNLLVDSVIQFDRLNKDFSCIASKLNIPYNNELNSIRLKSNIRCNQDYRTMYNEITKEIVHESFRDVINYFDYKF